MSVRRDHAIYHGLKPSIFLKTFGTTEDLTEKGAAELED